MGITLDQKDTGYRGIWYYNQPSDDEYVYKYSAKHRPFAVYRPQVDKTFFCIRGHTFRCPSQTQGRRLQR